jgi:hypothetical protein
VARARYDRTVSINAGGVSGVRVVAYFPIDFPHASRHGAWPPAHLDHLRAAGARWRTPQPTDDLALQAYGHDVLDALVALCPRRCWRRPAAPT